MTPDRYYEEKIVRGLVTPTFAYLTPEQAEATVNGRYRGDGRCLDQYVVDDPLLIDLTDPLDAC